MNTAQNVQPVMRAHVFGGSAASQILWTCGFAAATAAGARLEIPHEPVPFTLQTLFVLLAGGLLGARNGAISQMLYLGIGLAGAPVFSGGAFGLARILGPTGGYLLAFPVAAAIVGYILSKRQDLWWSFVAMAAGLLIIFLSGTAQLYTVFYRDWTAAFQGGFLIFSWWDLLKLSAAGMICHEVSKRWKPGSGH
jgi:biotin transport system substrate-specific component